MPKRAILGLSVIFLFSITVFALPGFSKEPNSACDPQKDPKLSQANAANVEGLKLLDNGKPAEALAKFEEAEKMQPAFKDAVFNHAIALARLGRHEEAITKFDQALQLQEKWEWALLMKGDSLFELKRPDEAMTNYRKAIAAKPEFRDPYLRIAAMELANNRPDKTQAILEEGLKASPDDVDLNWQLGLLFMGQGKGQAFGCFKKVEVKDPERPQLPENLAMSAYLANDKASAAKYAQLSIQKNPEDYQGHWMLVSLFIEESNWVKCREILDRMIVKWPENRTLRLTMLKTLILSRAFNEAEKYAESLKAVAPKEGQWMESIALEMLSSLETIKENRDTMAVPFFKLARELFMKALNMDGVRRMDKALNPAPPKKQ